MPNEPGKLGRPRMLTEELQEKICQLVAVGNYMDTAAAACGITDRTVYAWLRRGQDYIERHGEDPDTWPPREADDECDFAHFLRAVTKANAEAEAYAVTTVRKAMPQQWQAAMTFLERRYPNKWRRRVAVDSGDDVSERQRIDEARMLEDPEAVGLLHDALAKVASGEIEIEDAEVVGDADST